MAGVLAFPVSARTREWGVRLAIGSTPGDVMARVLREGAGIVLAGVAAGAVGGYVLARLAQNELRDVPLPGAWPAVGAAALLVVAAVLAALSPAARASRVDVVQALRSE